MIQNGNCLPSHRKLWAVSERKSCTLEQKLKATKERKEIKKRHPPIRRERPEVVRLGGRTRAQMERIRGTVKGRKTHSRGCLESWRSPSLHFADQERWAWGGRGGGALDSDLMLMFINLTFINPFLVMALEHKSSSIGTDRIFFCVC